MTSSTDKYLQTYAEREQFHIPDLLALQFQHLLVVPAYRETWEDFERVTSQLNHADSAGLLTILVANSPQADDPMTMALIREVMSRSTLISQRENLHLLQRQPHGHILLVDRTSQPLPKTKGVGLARKIGADIALRLISEQRTSKPYIFTTDCDVILPSDYFSTTMFEPLSAAVYPFEHQPDPGFELAMLLYDIHLLYYAAGLKQAGSHYGFTTIGSTLVINARHYAEVRGFPRRSAGEDFYLLNKLNKVGRITSLQSAPIIIQGRPSTRVPFGTGPALEHIQALGAPTTEYKFYHPKIFTQLRHFLQLLHSSQAAMDLEEHFSPSEFTQFCETQDLFNQIQSKRHLKPGVFDKFLHDWMDGFRTLKFVHGLRSQQFQSVDIEQLLRQNPLGIEIAANQDLAYRLRQFREQLRLRLF